jgi:2-methylcitrate dehydratase PrpD
MAQPAVEAALSLRREHPVTISQIASINVQTFQAAGYIMHTVPESAEAAQYSLPYTLAVALCFGAVTREHLEPEFLTDPRILSLSQVVSLDVCSDFQELWPEQRLARVIIRLKTGELLVSKVCAARGDPEYALGDESLSAKFRQIAVPVLGSDRASRIAQGVDTLDSINDMHELLDDLLTAIENCSTRCAK